MGIFDDFERPNIVKPSGLQISIFKLISVYQSKKLTFCDGTEPVGREGRQDDYEHPFNNFLHLPFLHFQLRNFVTLSYRGAMVL